MNTEINHLLEELEDVEFEIEIHVKHMKKFPNSNHFETIRELQQERQEILTHIEHLKLLTEVSL